MKAGDVLGPSSWIEVKQERIDAFADCTEDRQSIHVDASRAAQSAFGGTVAHGFLTLSLVAPAVFELVGEDDKDVVNYGLNRVRFPAPVPAGSRIRTTLEVKSIEEVSGGDQVTYGVTVEREGGERPVCVAELIFRYVKQ